MDAQEVEAGESLDELDRDARLDQRGELLGVPVGEPHAAMRGGLVDLGRLRQPSNTVPVTVKSLVFNTDGMSLPS